jgi:hypothetical protein
MIESMFEKLNIPIMGSLISLLMGNEYQSDEWIQYINYNTKILISHSPGDEIIPYKEGKKLFDLISKTHHQVKFINIAGTHNNLGLTDNYIYSLSDLFYE